MSLPSITVRRKVEFSDTDAAGLVHFSNYFRYMESAERAFFERAGIPLFESAPDRLSGFPRVDAQCSFVRPLRYGDEVSITLTLEKVRSAGLHFGFLLEKLSASAAPEMVAQGSLTTVYSRFDRDTGQIQAGTLPVDWLRSMGWEQASTGG